MRFGLVHRIMTDALAALGVLAVVNTASMSPWTTGIVLVSLALALAVPDAWQSKPALRHLATIGPLTLFAVQGARLLAGRPALDVAVEFAAVLQIIRLATRRGAAHDQQIIVLALLHFVAGTVLGGGLSYGLCFIGFLVVAPGALVLSHLRREVEGNYRQGARDRTGLPVDVVAVPEGGALGAAYLARVTAGLERSAADSGRWARTGRRVEPDPVWSAAMAERYERFRALTGTPGDG